MPSESAGCRPLRVPVPKCRDPFVVTPLLRLRTGGGERFWISTFNSADGCTGVLLDADGGHRLYRFDSRHAGFYSAVQEDEDTLWLCGNLAVVVRLSLRTGKTEAYATGAPEALVYQGMILDPGTHKLFVAAYPPPVLHAVSFDTRSRKTVRIHRDFAPDHYMRCSSPNGDGTFSFILDRPGDTLARWDPREETISYIRLLKTKDSLEEIARGTTYFLIRDDEHRAYIPRRGWHDPRTGRIDPSGPLPDTEMTWFARRGHTAFGVNWSLALSSITVGAWDMATGAVQIAASIPDGTLHGVNLTDSGKLVCVTMYGEFTRRDMDTGGIECARLLPVEGVQNTMNCLQRIDKRRLLGAPFITQRFWEADVKTGKGMDCGRAAPGLGEICKTWRIGRKIYMAVYDKGELVEYDPEKPPRFPENPRVVAKPPHAMRPIAAADDGRRIFYSCGAPYGFFGCTLTRYDTRTGQCLYARDPVPGQRIGNNLWFEKKRDSLLGTSVWYGEGCSPPESRACFFVRLSAADLSVLDQARVPGSVSDLKILGPMGKDRWLCEMKGSFEDFPVGWLLCVLESAPLRAPATDSLHLPPGGCRRIEYAGKTGRFVLLAGNRVELWDMRKTRRVDTLYASRGEEIRTASVQDGSLYLFRRKDILVLDDVLVRRGSGLDY